MTRDWQAVADALLERIESRGWTRQTIVDRAGLSRSTLTDLLSGKPRDYTDATLASFSRAVEWPAHTLRDIADGGQPPEDVDPAELAALVLELTAEVRRLSDRVERALPPDGPPAA